MDLGIVRTIGAKELGRHGIRVIDSRVALRTLKRTPGDVTLLSTHGTSTDFRMDTVSAHPDHSVFAFMSADSLWSRAHDEPWQQIESGLIFSTLGITRELRCVGPWSATIAFVPRNAIASVVPTLAPEVEVFPEPRLLDRAMQGFIQGLLDVDEPATPIARYALEQLIIEMGRAILLDRRGASEDASPHTALRESAIALIAQQCGDPNLTSARVAGELQSSLRLLQLVFAEADVKISVAGEIRRQRARLARSLLIDTRYDTMNMAQIAKRSGFQSPMSMRRALDATYNTSPAAIRALPRM